MMHGDGRVDQVAAQRPKPCEDAIFIRASKPGEPTMSDTKIAASLRVSLTALAPKPPDRRVAVA
jgi:hypothetical protein